MLQAITAVDGSVALKKMALHLLRKLIRLGKVCFVQAYFATFPFYFRIGPKKLELAPQRKPTRKRL